MSEQDRSCMHRLYAGLAVLALLAPLMAAAAADPDPSGARALIERTVDDVLKILNDEALDSAERRSRLEQLAWERFDFDTMSKAVVARYWRSFTAPQKVDFVAEFKAFLSRTYGDRIDRYTNEQVEVVGQRVTPRGNVMILTRIVGGQYGGAEVEYMLKHREDRWRVIDVKVEGISLVLNYRDQFKSLLAKGGPEHLLEQLKKKNAEAATS